MIKRIQGILCSVLIAAGTLTSVQCSDDDSSAEKNITAFTFAGLDPAVAAAVNQADRTITATVPAGTDVTALVPTITVPPTATVTPAPGAARDFTEPVLYTVTAQDGTRQTYTVTVTIAAPLPQDCWPTVLAGPEGLVYVTYNTDNTVKQVTSPAYGDSPEYTTEYLYTDGKRTRVNLYADRKMIGYNLITHTATKTTEEAYEYLNDDVYKARTFIHYHESGRTIATADYFGDVDAVRYDSVYYTYASGNIIRVDGYDDQDQALYYNRYQYDDKINPHARIDISGSLGTTFLPVSRSKNNIIGSDQHYGEDHARVLYSYTYDTNGLPLTFTDDIQTLNFDYTCY
ncbi:DUF5018 domain-containing protein [Dawidia soli]|uniref:DUF5018 domain-containing protein n=1 Tax=Dawidia soli TaxID=2782352 RepID=A0AAP2GH40_9BACT|nr:DUF5018 domain-containing protein [Dawidia soli]MBT1686811.1 DUF5018 domain-containing protein [Dawidia soli]